MARMQLGKRRWLIAAIGVFLLATQVIAQHVRIDGITQFAQGLVINAGQILLPNGTSGLPSLAFSALPTKGMYSPTTNAIGFTSQAVPKLWIDPSNGFLRTTSDMALAWGTTTNLDSAVMDTGISRAAAGIVALGNGTQGDRTANLILTSIGMGSGGGITWLSRSSVTSPADGLFNLTQNSAATVGVQMNMGTAAPTLTACGTGALTAHSNNMFGEVTPTGASACTVTFGLPNWTFQPFCSVTFETVAESYRISAISTTAFTVTFTTAANKFMYTCGGGSI